MVDNKVVLEELKKFFSLKLFDGGLGNTFYAKFTTGFPLEDDELAFAKSQHRHFCLTEKNLNNPAQLLYQIILKIANCDEKRFREKTSHETEALPSISQEVFREYIRKHENKKLAASSSSVLSSNAGSSQIIRSVPYDSSQSSTSSSFSSQSALPLPNSGLVVEAPLPKSQEEGTKKSYVNIYPNSKNYNNQWDLLFGSRRPYEQEEVRQLNEPEGVQHQTVNDYLFAMKRVSSEKASFHANISEKVLKDKENALKSNGSQGVTEIIKEEQAKAFCCMIDQIVANMLAEGVPVEDIELSLNGPSKEVLQTGLLYARLRYGIKEKHISLAIKGKVLSSAEVGVLALIKDDTTNGFNMLMNDRNLLKNKAVKNALNFMISSGASSITNMSSIIDWAKKFSCEKAKAASASFIAFAEAMASNPSHSILSAKEQAKASCLAMMNMRC